ncbi:hypothetical protein JL722_14178 [Aureococcus anophagefferens]|nr:hypothetical protein JL722_14178 [Aureococcus anophagefferens]
MDDASPAPATSARRLRVPGWGVQNCGHAEDASVECYAPGETAAPTARREDCAGAAQDYFSCLFGEFCNFDYGGSGGCESCASFASRDACGEDGLPSDGEDDCVACCFGGDGDDDDGGVAEFSCAGFTTSASFDKSCASTDETCPACGDAWRGYIECVWEDTLVELGLDCDDVSCPAYSYSYEAESYSYGGPCDPYEREFGLCYMTLCADTPFGSQVVNVVAVAARRRLEDAGATTTVSPTSLRWRRRGAGDAVIDELEDVVVDDALANALAAADSPVLAAAAVDEAAEPRAAAESVASVTTAALSAAVGGAVGRTHGRPGSKKSSGADAASGSSPSSSSSRSPPLALRAAYVAIKRSAESSHYGAADDTDVEVADLEMKAVVAIPTAPGEEYRAI